MRSPVERSLRPLNHRRQRGQDGLDIAARAQSEDGAPVVEQIEFNIAAAPHELFLAFRLGPGQRKVSFYQLGIDAVKGAADLLGECKIGIPITAVEVIEEDAADAAHLLPMLQIEIVVAPFLIL